MIITDKLDFDENKDNIHAILINEIKKLISVKYEYDQFQKFNIKVKLEDLDSYR